MKTHNWHYHKIHRRWFRQNPDDQRDLEREAPVNDSETGEKIGILGDFDFYFPESHKVEKSYGVRILYKDLDNEDYLPYLNHVKEDEYSNFHLDVAIKKKREMQKLHNSHNNSQHGHATSTNQNQNVNPNIQNIDGVRERESRSGHSNSSHHSNHSSNMGQGNPNINIDRNRMGNINQGPPPNMMQPNGNVSNIPPNHNSQKHQRNMNSNEGMDGMVGPNNYNNDMMINGQGMQQMINHNNMNHNGYDYYD